MKLEMKIISKMTPYRLVLVKRVIRRWTFSLLGKVFSTCSKNHFCIELFLNSCILAELFTEEPLFNLTQMLHYRQEGYNPMLIVDKIPDENIRVRFQFKPIGIIR